MSPTPLRSDKGAFIRTPGIARETTPGEVLSEFECRALVLAGFNDLRSRWIDGSSCAQSQGLSNAWVGQQTRDRIFRVFRDGVPTPPSPTLVDVLQWRIVGQTSGAELVVNQNADVTACDNLPGAGALETGHYHSTAGQVGPGSSDIYYTYDLKIETYTGGLGEGDPAAIIHPIWNGATPVTFPPFTDNELCDIFIPAP